MSKRIYQRSIPIFLISVIATFMVVNYFIALPTFANEIVNELYLWGIIITTVVKLYGFAILLGFTLKALVDRKSELKKRYHSGVLIASFCAYLILGLITPNRELGPFFRSIYIPTLARVGGAVWAGGNIKGIIYGTKYTFSRVRTFTGGLFFITWLLITARDTSALVGFFPPFLTVGNWITNVPVAAGYRASFIAMGVGTIVLGLRAIVGKEQGLIEMEAK